MSEYTPTPEEVRESYVVGVGPWPLDAADRVLALLRGERDK